TLPAKSDSAQRIQVSSLPFFESPTIGNGIRVEVQHARDIENEAAEQLRPRIQEHSIVHGLHPLLVKLRAIGNQQQEGTEETEKTKPTLFSVSSFASCWIFFQRLVCLPLLTKNRTACNKTTSRWK